VAEVGPVVRPPSSQPLKSVWWAAADTRAYNPAVGGGLWDLAVSSLVKREQRNLKCGDLATFMLKIETSADVPGPISSTNTVNFDGDSTGQSGVAFEYIDSATVSLNDPVAVLTTATRPRVALEQTLHGALYETAKGAKAYTEATIMVTDMQPGDVVVVRINARIGCLEGAAPTGVLQAKLERSLGSGVEVDRKLIHGGTIPLKLADVAAGEGGGGDPEDPTDPEGPEEDFCACDFVGAGERAALCLNFVAPIAGVEGEVLCSTKACTLKGGLKCVDGGSKVCSRRPVINDVLSFLRIDPITENQICNYKSSSGEIIVQL